MSFKPKNAKIDLTLDMSEYLLKTELDNNTQGFIKATKQPTADEYINWAVTALTNKDLTKEEKEAEKQKIEEDPKYAMTKIVNQIDYWYNKGFDWWVKRCPFPVLQEVLNFLSDVVVSIQKK